MNTNNMIWINTFPKVILKTTFIMMKLHIICR